MLKKLKSLFIIEDESTPKGESDKSKKTQKQVNKAPQPVAKKSNAKGDSSFKVGDSNVKPDPKFINVLLKAIDASNSEGFDYLEYKQSLQSLSKMAMDEKTRYQSAFAMAQTMGATQAKLIDSANHYMKILFSEEKKFETALENQRSKQIANRQNEIGQLENLIKEKQLKIKSLNKEIEQHQRRLNKSAGEIKNATEKVESTRLRFVAAYNLVLGQIKADVDRMTQYLK